MAKYLLEMKFSYLIETDDMKSVLDKMEFPLFDLDDDSVEFLDNTNAWEEAEEEEGE